MAAPVPIPAPPAPVPPHVHAVPAAVAQRTPLALVANRFNCPGLASLLCSPADVPRTASALLHSCFASDPDAKAAIAGNPARIRELLSFITGDPQTRLDQLNTLNPYLVKAHKIWKFALKKSAVLDTGFVATINALPATDKQDLFDYLNGKPANAIDKLREYVFSNGEEKTGLALTRALKLIAKVGILQDAAISKQLLHGWLLAQTECVENSGILPTALMTAPVLKQHFEKHCCNMHNNNKPAEAAWWAAHLHYSFTLQNLRNAGIHLTAADIALLCPNGGEEIRSAYLVEQFFTNYVNGAHAQTFADGLPHDYQTRYGAYIERQFKTADHAFIRFEGGKIQVAARKGLYFMMATYNPQGGNAYRLDLMSAYFPDDLDTHWANLQAHLIWWIK
jgi:hypothetical protein